MALCSFSSKLSEDGYTVIENSFFSEFLPQATGDDVKVYLYGLSLCASPSSNENNLDTIAKVLSITEEQAIKAFEYWQEMGLVQIVSKDPFEVRFLPVRFYAGSNKIRKPEKYTDFNKQIEEIISGRTVTPVELNHYYTLIESEHFDPDALVLIATHCVSHKSNTIGYPYILATAKSFAENGLKTYDAIEGEIKRQEMAGAEIKQILKALGLNRNADLDERNLYLKWLNKFGFSHGVILQVAKNQKRGGFVKLDETLSKYYERKLFTLQEINTYSEKQEEMFSLAKEVCKTIGVYYQNYDNVVDTYISNWLSKGYEKDALIFVANYCFKQSLRTLDGMNVIVQKFFKLGLVSLESIEQYIESIIKNDEQIHEVLDSLGLLRNVSSSDRDLYRTWTGNWGFTHEQILLVSGMIKDKSNQMTYLARVLSNLYAQNATSNDEIIWHIQEFGKKASDNSSAKKHNFLSRELSKEQLSAVIDSLDEVEI